MLEYSFTGFDKALKRLDVIAVNIEEATLHGMLRAAEDATVGMEERIVEATTETGIARTDSGYGLYAGRIDTGAMIGSLRASDGEPGKAYYDGSGRVNLDVGYTHNPPEYTEEQETTKYSISGKLMALQVAYDILSYAVPIRVHEELLDLAAKSTEGYYRASPISHRPKWGV